MNEHKMLLRGHRKHTECKAERTKSLIDLWKTERIKGSITTHFDDHGNVTKIDKHDIE